MLNQGAFTALTISQKERALAGARRLGYEFSVRSATIEKQNDMLYIELSLINKGVAPFYITIDRWNWPPLTAKTKLKRVGLRIGNYLVCCPARRKNGLLKSHCPKEIIFCWCVPSTRSKAAKCCVSPTKHKTRFWKVGSRWHRLPVEHYRGN
jgi:hypothetical protein